MEIKYRWRRRVGEEGLEEDGRAVEEVRIEECRRKIYRENDEGKIIEYIITMANILINGDDDN